MLAEQELQSLKNRFGIIGNDSSLNYALRVAHQVANTDLTVLILGESGVGKEVFSKIIHAYSARKHNHFIAINCGAIPEGTIDSELFGHEKGSFTSAVDSRKGYFETVNGGTIFLDEIGEMPIGTQARLLRVLETGEYIRVGSSKVLKTNVRVIAATNKDLKEWVQQGRFREDLYYRLNTVPIRVPSLRERKKDIPVLFRKFCVDFADKYRTQSIQLTSDAEEYLINYSWPGNIRELKNMAEQISVLAPNKLVKADELAFLLPEDQEQRLPMVLPRDEKQTPNQFSSERDLLYKVFFDMKKDVTDVKKMFFEILKNPNLASQYAPHPGDAFHTAGDSSIPLEEKVQPLLGTWQNNEESKPIVISHPGNDAEEVEEELNLASHEKKLITKALKKHKGRRRNAAGELGISERTLYRKINEYNIDE